MKRTIGLFLIAFISIILCSCNTETKKETEKQNVVSNQDVQDKTVDEKSETGSNNFDEEQILDLSDLKDGDVYNNLTVANYQYTPHETFEFTLLGEFEASGNLIIDEMWDELAITFDDSNNPHKNLIMDNNGFQKELVKFCYFRNPDDLKRLLSSEAKVALDNGESVNITLKVKDFKMGGKLDGYGECSVDFVELVD